MSQTDQLRVRAGISHTPGDSEFEGIDTGLLEKFVTMSGNDFISGTQLIGSSAEEQIAGNEIGTIGYVLIKNVASENFVRIGFADVSTADDARPVKLEPGEIALFRAAGGLYAQADTSDVRIQYYFFED